MTLLSIAQSVAPRLGIPKPTSVANSTDLTIQLLMAYINEAGLHLSRYHDWQNLTIEEDFTSLGTQIQTGALPSDFDRLIYNVQMWNSSRNTRIVRANQRRWRYLLQYGGNAGVGGFYRILLGELNVLPAQPAGEIIKFEYISKNWVTLAAGGGANAFAADADTTALDEELIALHTLWRYRKHKGLAQYAEDMATAERESEKVAANDRSTSTAWRDPRSDSPPPQPYWSAVIT